MRSFSTTGEDRPRPGTTAFQAIPLVSLQFTGTCLANEVPSPRGPRNCGQLCSPAPAAAAPPMTGLHDYTGILHAHAEDSAHTGGTRPEMLADAKNAGVQVIMLTDHLRPPRDFMDSWRGFHEGVLFIPGSEAKGFLVYPASSIMDRMEEPTPKLVASVTASNGLIFLSHIEERRDHPM